LKRRRKNGADFSQRRDSTRPRVRRRIRFRLFDSFGFLPS
jgi:hypothetical protein